MCVEYVFKIENEELPCSPLKGDLLIVDSEKTNTGYKLILKENYGSTFFIVHATEIKEGVLRLDSISPKVEYIVN